MRGKQRIPRFRATFEVLGQLVRVLQIVSDDLIDVWQLQTVVLLHDLLGRGAAIEGSNHEIEGNARTANAIYSLGVSSQRNFVKDGGHV